MTLTAEQIAELKRGESVRIPSPEVGEDVVLVPASIFTRLTDTLEDEAEKRAWASVGMEAASRWAEENPY